MSLDRQAVYQLGLCWSEAASALRRTLERKRVPADRRSLERGAYVCLELAREFGQPTEAPLARHLLALFEQEHPRPALADLLGRSARILTSAADPGPLDPGFRARASEIHEFLSNAYFLLLWDLATPAHHAAS